MGVVNRHEPTTNNEVDMALKFNKFIIENSEKYTQKELYTMAKLTIALYETSLTT